uniref:Uncharacterized protein n=1 Tax=Setaria viridis TaxID=4556 RepID=A0A4U6TFG3_SETVI|nr:hypothetical protein SEVIR_8G051250v2 [Setaria viridis]
MSCRLPQGLNAMSTAAPPAERASNNGRAAEAPAATSCPTGPCHRRPLASAPFTVALPGLAPASLMRRRQWLPRKPYPRQRWPPPASAP